MSWSRNRGKYQEGSPPTPRQRVRVIFDSEEAAAEGQSYIPPMDIYEKDEVLVIEVELPGMKKEDIGVYVSSSLVTIEGSKEDVGMSAGDPGQRASYLQLERKLGKFRREIELTLACNTRDAKARYEQGILVIEFQKIKDRRGGRIRIPVD